MMKPATNKAPAKSAAPAKKTAKPEVAASRRFNLTYVTKESDRKMIEGGAPSKVYAFVAAAGAKGLNRDQIEAHFDADETINVKSSLDYMVKFELMATIPV